jgi:hypothetical protein
MVKADLVWMNRILVEANATNYGLSLTYTEATKLVPLNQPKNQGLRLSARGLSRTA